jgi:hypothetical protein
VTVGRQHRVRTEQPEQQKQAVHPRLDRVANRERGHGEQDDRRDADGVAADPAA